MSVDLFIVSGYFWVASAETICTTQPEKIYYPVLYRQRVQTSKLNPFTKKWNENKSVFKDSNDANYQKTQFLKISPKV